MKWTQPLFLLFCLFATACKEQVATHNRNGLDTPRFENFPILIEGGSRAVYQIGKMTPRGLKYFLDTVDVKDQRFVLPDSMRLTFLSPLNMKGDERQSAPGIIAISQPGFWEETIFGIIDDTGYLRINYNNEIELAPQNNSAFNANNWSGVFRNDSITVRITADLSETKDTEHLAGQGRLFLIKREKLIEEQKVILVVDKKVPTTKYK